MSLAYSISLGAGTAVAPIAWTAGSHCTGKLQANRLTRPASAEVVLMTTRSPQSGSPEPRPDGSLARRGRVVVADDDVLLREGIASLLERNGFEVVGQAGDGTNLLGLIREHTPELAVVDIRMPPTHTLEGLEAAQQIRKSFADTGIVLLSAYVEVEHAVELLAGGRRVGYLLKRRVTDVNEFVDALERVMRGGSVVDPSLIQELMRAQRKDDPLAVLSAREREVLALMAEGRSNAGIAHALWVTEGTVEKHVQHILTKLQLPDSGDDHRRVLAVITFLEAR
ncbi:response regulator transcription factor [Amycolatopsis pithecellobii]|nr:response regulator transcription factor [Amycolatopsis pithecellobii]